MAQKPTPHYTDLAAAMKQVTASHDEIISSIGQHAERHAAHIHKMREERERELNVRAGIERQTAALQAGSTGQPSVTLRVLDSDN